MYKNFLTHKRIFFVFYEFIHYSFEKDVLDLERR